MTYTERDALISAALLHQEKLNQALDALAEHHKVDCYGVTSDLLRDSGIIRNRERVALLLRFDS